MRKKTRLPSFPQVTHEYVEALTQSYQEFRSEQKIPLDKIKSLYHQCGQVYEKWTQAKRSELHAVVKKEIIAPVMTKLQKEQRALMSICRGAVDGQVWFKDNSKKAWLPIFKKTLKTLDKKQLHSHNVKVKNIIDSIEADVDFYVKNLNLTRDVFMSPSNESELKEANISHLKCKLTQCEVLCCLALENSDSKAAVRVIRNIAGHEQLESKMPKDVLKDNTWKDLMHPFLLSDIVKHIDEVRAKAQTDLGHRPSLRQLAEWVDVNNT